MGLFFGLLVGCGSSGGSGNLPSGVGTAGTVGAAGVSAGTSPPAAVGGSSGVSGVGAAGTSVATAGVSAAISGSGGSAIAGTGGAGGSGVAGSAESNAGASGAAVSGSGGSGGSGGSAGAGGAAEPACDMQIPSSMDCTAKLAPGDERTCMLGTRQYIVYAPKNFNPCQPAALVIDGHGATETAPQQAGEAQFCSGTTCWHGLGSGWKAEADQPGAGFIVVFPQGVNNMWQQSDADFMVSIVGDIKKVATIDPKKVYITGISNGGFLTYWTGCPHSDVFSGMSPNSGGANCTSVVKPIPVIAFDDMPDFAYQGSVDAVNTMVKLNGCTGDAKPWKTIDKMYTEPVCRSAKEDTMAQLIPCNMVTTDIQPTTCKIWDQCQGGVQVVFCEVAANTEHGSSNAALDGHIIYENNTLLNTPSLAWRFFKQFW